MYSNFECVFFIFYNFILHNIKIFVLSIIKIFSLSTNFIRIRCLSTNVLSRKMDLSLRRGRLRGRNMHITFSLSLSVPFSLVRRWWECSCEQESLKSFAPSSFGRFSPPFSFLHSFRFSALPSSTKLAYINEVATVADGNLSRLQAPISLIIFQLTPSYCLKGNEGEWMKWGRIEYGKSVKREEWWKAFWMSWITLVFNENLEKRRIRN